MTDLEREWAEKLYDDGSLEELTKYLAPFLEVKDAFAINLISCFSQPGESDSTFAERYIKQQTEASSLGHAGSSYQMGVNFLYGDDVSQSYVEAAKYFERAISQGHTHTKFTFGCSLYYGTDENPVDKVRGLALLEEAAQEGSEGAKNELQRINT